MAFPFNPRCRETPTPQGVANKTVGFEKYPVVWNAVKIAEHSFPSQLKYRRTVCVLQENECGTLIDKCKQMMDLRGDCSRLELPGLMIDRSPTANVRERAAHPARAPCKAQRIGPRRLPEHRGRAGFGVVCERE
jgi:hypothetical protein